jgi:hypothetical protein
MSVPASHPRPRFRKKSEWARDKARELQRQANELRYQSTTSSVRAARKYEGVRNLEREASRFDAIARRLEEKGQ